MKYLQNFNTFQDYETYITEDFDRPLVANVNIPGNKPKFHKDYYLTFKVVSATATIKITKVGSPTNVQFEYMIFPGKWIQYDFSTISLKKNDKIKIRNSSSTVYSSFGGNSAYYYKFEMTGTIEGSGDVTSLFKKHGGNVTLGWYTFEWLFYNCKSLTKAPYFPSLNFTGMHSYRSVFNGCTNLKEYHFATFNNNVIDSAFIDNSSGESLIIDDPNPPTINETSLSGLNATCIIYVQDDSVNDYKSAQYWSDRADYIRGISEKPVFIEYLETHGTVYFEIERTQSWPITTAMRFSPAEINKRQDLTIYPGIETIYLNANNQIITSITGTTSYSINANDIVDAVEHPEWINNQGKWYYHASMRQNNASSWRSFGSAYKLPDTTTSTKIRIFSSSYPPSEGTKLYFYRIADSANSTAAKAWDQTPNSNYVACIYKGEVGLWDTKSKTFYGNKGSGYAKAGPRL